jgi:hypothetical protein
MPLSREPRSGLQPLYCSLLVRSAHYHLRADSRCRPQQVQSTPSLTKLAVEIEGGADEGKVGEGLREVAQGLAARADLLCVEP